MNFLFLLLVFLFATKFTHAQPISGQIKKPQKNYIVFHSAGKYCLNVKSDTIKLNKDGRFHYSGSSDLPVENGILEIASKQTLKIWCPTNIKLIITIEDSSSIPIFSGSLATIHRYLQTEDQYWEKIYKKYELRNSNFKKPPFLRSDEYYRITDSILTDRLSFLENYFKGSKRKEERLFIVQRKQELLYQDLFYKLSYDDPPLEKFIFYQEHFKSKSLTSYKFSDQISFNDPGILNNHHFLNFSRAFLMELVFRFQKEQNIKLSKERFYEKLFSFIDQLSRNTLCNEVLKASFINGEVNTMSIDEKNTELSYSRFVDSIQTYSSIKKEAKLIENKFNSKLAKLYALKTGTVAPSCILTDTTGQFFSLESFKGKLLYIDVWASWCGKCIEAIPQWNKLINKFKGNPNVTFITISTDVIEDKAKWLTLLNRFKPEGLHFISPGGTDSEFAKKFLVNSYPTNILINKEGHIINIKADRPDTIDLSAYLK